MRRVSLHLFDTATRSAREFQPLRDGAASIYVCGATVQGIPHIGHVRSGLNFDVLGRWLTRKGLTVTLVRNVTDIDDKILTKARQNKKPWWEWASIHERAFSEAYRQLGCTPPAVEPRATGHITQMVELMARLIDAGHAYAAEGNVYFAVGTYEDYCSLSRQKLDDVHQGEGGAPGKRDPRDFTMWKAAKPGEPSWPTPWGPGRPGWHLECSAMAHTYLGAEFDIHGGGIDLIFPHHENEQAQSRAAGDGFARYWLHNGWVTLSGEKMSKSLGNTVSIPAMLERVRAVELRYYLISAHYRSSLEYSAPALEEAVVAYKRIEGFLRRAAERVGTPGLDPSAPLNEVFERNLDDDLGTPGALAAIHNTVREGNAALDAGDRDAAAAAAASVRSMTDVLGVDPYAPNWASGAGDDQAGGQALSTLVEELLEERTRARAARDFAASDAVRDRLAAAGIVVEDTPDGPSWSLKG